MATCKCGPCTHPKWKKRCAFKGGRAMAKKDKKLWESSPTADGWALLQLCGYGGDSAKTTWRHIKPARYVPWPEAVETLRELMKTRSSRLHINEGRERVLKELEAHFALVSEAESSGSNSSNSSSSSSSDSSSAGAATTTSSTKTPDESSRTDDVDSGAPPVPGQRLELPTQLATLLGRVQLPKVRTTPNQEYALMDIGMAITGKDANHAAQDLQIVLIRFPEFTQNLGECKFEGPGRKDVFTKVGNLAKVIEYIMLLPGTTAARVRVEASKILVRYLGGDLKMIEEVRNMRRVQEHLTEVDPTNWRRAFGEAVEQDAAVDPPLRSSFKLRVHDVDVIGDKALGDLYLMCVTDSSGSLVAWKVGRSNDPLQRTGKLDGEARRYLNRNWTHRVADIVRGAGCLEPLVLRGLADLQIEGMREYFRDAEGFRDRFLEQCHDAVSVWAEQRFQNEKKVRADAPEDEHELLVKRRRVELSLRSEEIKLSHEELAAQEKAFLLHERSTRLHLEAQERLTEMNVSAQERLASVQERLAALKRD